jgi:hypothetical protein
MTIETYIQVVQLLVRIEDLEAGNKRLREVAKNASNLLSEIAFVGMQGSTQDRCREMVDDIGDALREGESPKKLGEVIK